MWTRLRAIASRLIFVLARRRFDEGVRLEIDAHLDLLTERYLREGLSPDQAYVAARRRFGNTIALRQDIHDMNSIGWIEQAVQDLRGLDLVTTGRAERLRVLRVSSGYFSTLGSHPRLGSDFDRSDEAGTRRIVLSDIAWRTHFGGDPSIVGTTIRLSAEPYVRLAPAAEERSWREHTAVPV
jgi:hypothetical protein